MTELDQIKSTITVSLGLKNRLRDLKGSQSYEDFIAYLIRMRNHIAHDNVIELQKFERKQSTFTSKNHKIVFSYNKFNNSSNYIFDIAIDFIREPNFGNKIMLHEFISAQRDQYDLYFELLSFAIQQEIEPLFKHKGRFEDHYSWKKEFEILGLSKTAFQNDVMDKLTDFENGIPLK